MIGLHELLNLRLNGSAPADIWIHVLDHPAEQFMVRDAKDAIADGFFTSLLLNPQDPISTIDFSPISGSTVHIIGSNERRCTSVFNTCRQFAKRVLASGFSEKLLDSENA